MQTQFELIPHTVDGELIQQRKDDGYINATAMCKAAHKNWADYARLSSTREFLSELSSAMGIPITELIQSVAGGTPTLQGTWVHPQVAIHLAQWLSAQFAVQVSKWVYDWMSSGRVGAQQSVPYHLRRYARNQKNVPDGHFSILTEMTQAIIAPMEIEGYTLPERMLPDISQGKMFCKWLREAMDIDTDRFPTYLHYYEDGRIISAKRSEERRVGKEC